MTKQHRIDPVEVARISRDIQDTLGFIEDVIDDPSSVHQVPSGSTLVFRTIQVLDDSFRLIAFRPSGSDDEWLSRVTSRISPGYGANGVPHQESGVSDVVMRGRTANDALDALEAALQEWACSPGDPLHPGWRR